MTDVTILEEFNVFKIEYRLNNAHPDEDDNHIEYFVASSMLAVFNWMNQVAEIIKIEKLRQLDRIRVITEKK